MKTALLAGAAITASPLVCMPQTPAAWARKTLVHPNVDNLRVVGITDSRMTRAVQPVTSWAAQERLVVREAVWENLDKLACGLAEARDPEEAWRAIFIEPPSKPWPEAVVAIKTNNISLQHTRSAVISKICHIFTGLLGVKGANIHIYDGVHGGSMKRNTPFADLPEGVSIEDKWGGLTTSVAVPAPWGEGRRTKCLGPLADGTVDILVNIALCKGHSDIFGGFTMAMKNQVGSFTPWFVHQDEGLEYLLAINQTPEILGPIDSSTGRVLYPRQQLCVIDALWASEGGPGGYPRSQPNFLAMGVFAPVLDYIMATRFRRERMKWDINLGPARRMLTEFGYRESDLPGGGRIIE